MVNVTNGMNNGTYNRLFHFKIKQSIMLIHETISENEVQIEFRLRNDLLIFLLIKHKYHMRRFMGTCCCILN